MPVSQGALRLLRLWALTHLDRSVNLREPLELKLCRRWVGWPRDDALDAIVDLVRREVERTPERRRSFQEYYNAAATLGVALAVKHPHQHETTAARVAVAYLERAVESAPRAMVWQYSRWFAAEDQSLKVLRGTPHYVDFLERHFPGMERREERPQNVLHYLLSTHVLEVARNYARASAEACLAHYPTDELDARRSMRRAVQVMEAYSRDYRDWRTRLTLIQSVHGTADEGVPAGLAFPKFQDEPGLASVRLGDARVDIDEYYDRLITRRLCPGIWPAVHSELEGVLDRIDPLTVKEPVDLCPMWEKLAELIDTSLEDRNPGCTRSPLVDTRLCEFQKSAQAVAISSDDVDGMLDRPVPPSLRGDDRLAGAH
jgi:hypothetical protein